MKSKKDVVCAGSIAIFMLLIVFSNSAAFTLLLSLMSGIVLWTMLDHK